MNHVQKKRSEESKSPASNEAEKAPTAANVQVGGKGGRSPEERLLTALRRIVHGVDLQSRRLLQQCSVTGPQLVCLHTLAEEGPLTSKGLAERVHVHPSTLVGIVDRLEEKGLLERQRDRSGSTVGVFEDDRTGAYVHPTCTIPITGNTNAQVEANETRGSGAIGQCYGGSCRIDGGPRR